MSEVEPFRVYVRCRPMNELQLSNSNGKKTVEIIDERALCINGTNDGKQHIFQLDQIFDENTQNYEVFEETIVPLIENVLNGINSTVFAYGITGSGKSHTMFGQSKIIDPEVGKNPGIIPLTFDYLLKQAQNSNDIKVKFSYIQIYNEQVFDLFSNNHTNLAITEDQNGVIVNDLNEVEVRSVEEANQLIEEGNGRRVVAQTKANQFSSRSHAIVVITVQRTCDSQIYIAKLSLVDLAGSQKQTVHEKSEAKNIRTLEGSNINKSLLALGNCINMLSDRKNTGQGNNKNNFVPYRDSKLTRLLKDSLGGNTKTTMIACVSQSCLAYDETINTLKYACRATKIEKVVHQNIKDTRTLQKYKKQCEGLKKENQALKLKMSKIMKNQNSKISINEGNIQVLQSLLEELVEAVEERCESDGSREQEKEIMCRILGLVVPSEKKGKKQSEYQKFRSLKSQNKGAQKCGQPIQTKSRTKPIIQNVKHVGQQNISPECHDNQYRSNRLTIPSLENIRKQNKFMKQQDFSTKIIARKMIGATLTSQLHSAKNNQNRHLVSLHNILKIKQDISRNFNGETIETNGYQFQEGLTREEQYEDTENFTDGQNEQECEISVSEGPVDNFKSSSCLYEEYRRMKRMERQHQMDSL